MKLTCLASALPPESPTGWGTASRRITEELGKLTLVHDFRGSAYLNRDFPIRVNLPVLQAMQGVNLLPMYPQIMGYYDIGYCFIEDDLLLKKYAENARFWSAVMCGSSWATSCMKEALRGQDIRVGIAIQGVDTDIFKPDPETRPDPSRFTIYSGGKFEYRKSQDVVIRAVGILMERHKDVYLKAAWWNPWPISMATMCQSKLINFTGDVENACAEHLDMSRVEFMQPVAHGGTVKHMNVCDVALFPNRCEAGTNLPMMEAMACDLPVIATVEHGHGDMRLGISIVIPSKDVVINGPHGPQATWYEPDLDSTVAALEHAYKRKETDCVNPREFISRFTWKRCAENLLEACE